MDGTGVGILGIRLYRAAAHSLHLQHASKIRTIELSEVLIPMNTAVDKPRGPAVGWAHIALIAAVILLGFAIRAYNFNEESVCLEEYVGFKYLDDPDVVTYIHNTRDLYKTMAPLYYSVEYFWTRLFGPSVASVRVISVLSGTLVLPLVYLFAWWFFGRDARARRAALLAMLFAALSPMHIYHSQEARQYAFFVLTGIVSAYALLRATRGGCWYWWTGSVAANLAVIYTHPFGIFLPFAEGLYILLVLARRRTQRPACAAWILGHMLVVALWFLWIQDMPKDPSMVFGPYVPKITFGRVFADIVGDDIPGMTSEFYFTEKTWPFLPQGAASALLKVKNLFQSLLVLALCAAIAWTALRAWRRFVAGREGGDADSTPAEDYALLLLWLFVPPLVLTAMSFFNPVHMPRYTVYSALALYVMLGGAIASIPAAAMRAAAGILTAVLYVYYASTGMPGLNNVDWRSMAKLVQSGSPDDVVLVHGTDYLNILLFHLDKNAVNINASTSSREGLAEASEFILTTCRQMPGENGRKRDVWAFIIMDNGPEQDFEKDLQRRGLTYQRTDFKGLRHFIVYHITEAARQNTAPLQFAPMSTYAQTVAKFIQDKEVKRFRRQISWDLDSWGGHFLRLGFSFAEKNLLELAAATISKSLEFHPQYVHEFMLMQYGFDEKLPFDDAVIPALKKGLSIQDESMQWWIPLAWEALAVSYERIGQPDKAAEARSHIKK